MKSGSKEAFYKWIDDVKKAYRHIKELEEKKLYWENRLNKYNAVTFDRIGSGTSNKSVEEKVLYVIGKINELKIKIKKTNKLIEDYVTFKSKLKEQEKVVLEYLVETSLSKREIAMRNGVSKSRVYFVINDIKKIHMKHIKNC